MSKERSDSTLGALPLHQQEQLIAWLIEERISPADAVDRVKNDFNVRTSLTAMYGFYRRHCAPRLLRLASQQATAIKDGAGGLTENLDQAGADLVAQKFFEIASNPDGINPKELAAFGQFVQNRQMLAFKERELAAKDAGFKLKYEQENRKLELAEAKFENTKFKVAEQTRKLREKGADLTDTERLQIADAVDQLMGVA